MYSLKRFLYHAPICFRPREAAARSAISTHKHLAPNAARSSASSFNNRSYSKAFTTLKSCLYFIVDSCGNHWSFPRQCSHIHALSSIHHTTSSTTKVFQKLPPYSVQKFLYSYLRERVYLRGILQLPPSVQGHDHAVFMRIFGYSAVADWKFDGGQAHMNSTRKDHLNVLGANLYYEIRGSGPVLLMIPGGPTDAS